jgi:membrane fusion protein (multidrug efflux system)
VRVRVVFADGGLHPETGEIDFVDVTVAQGTDTVSVRARIADPAGLLTDGQLVSVRVEDCEPEKRIVVPQAALLLDQ